VPLTDYIPRQQSSRYHGGRKSSGVHPIMTEEYQHHSLGSSAQSSDGNVSAASRNFSTPDTNSMMDETLPPTQSLPHRPRQVNPQHIVPSAMAAEVSRRPIEGTIMLDDDSASLVGEPGPMIEEPMDPLPQLRYPSQPYSSHSLPEITHSSDSLGRPSSTMTVGSGSNSDGTRLNTYRPHVSTGGRSPSPSASPMLFAQGHAQFRNSPDRPTSYIDLLQTPYAQQVAPAPHLDNSFLRQAVGSNASLLESSKTLQMYRANVHKTNDPAIQYEFAVFLIQTANAPGSSARPELLKEAKIILQRLADRSYPFAQYYLGDGYSSGLFNKGKEDYDRAFPLFVAASKRGHAEAGYRSALCYEFGWGCRKDYAKAVKFYEMAASKNHPGAATRLGLACINSSMGLVG
jgi:hypothetical protein